tara:strand:- start:81 stop:566 length:486 start_codon:yes stop_codon:yes gene_type:complete
MNIFKTRGAIFLIAFCVFFTFSFLETSYSEAAEWKYGHEDDVPNPFEDDLENIEAGAERFNARCTYCHGSRGIGAKGPCLTCGKFKRSGSSNLELYSVIAGGLTVNGQPTQMGGFSRTIEDEDIWRIMAYMRWMYKERKKAGEFEEGYNAVVEEKKRQDQQ